MELLYNYTNSTKNRAESQLLGFCSLLIGEKNLENEWFCKHNFSLSTDGRNGEQVVKV